MWNGKRLQNLSSETNEDLHKEALKKPGAAYTNTNILHMELAIIECSERLFQKLSGFADAKEKVDLGVWL